LSKPVPRLSGHNPVISLLRFLFLCASFILAGCHSAQPSFQSTDITGAEFGKAFALTDHDGKQRSLEDFRGQVVVMFFGFTHCPDVCPTTLAELAGAVKKLGPKGADVQVLLVTVDPERDTAELLAKYVTAFNPITRPEATFSTGKAGCASTWAMDAGQMFLCTTSTFC
jgi:cytochrome oxidase Cu insertion factor (SCO1/SenC/PrrC family)